jgi:hypothetical protein
MSASTGTRFRHHRTHKAAADATHMLFSADLVGQWFIDEREWVSADDSAMP